MGNTVKRISVFDNAITYYTTNDEKTEKKMIEFQPWMFTGPVKLKEKKWFTFRLQHPIWHLVMTKRQTNKIHFFFHITYVERVRVRCCICCIECRQQQRLQTLQKSSIPQATNLNESMRRIYCPKPYWNALIIVTNSTNFVVTWTYSLDVKYSFVFVFHWTWEKKSPSEFWNNQHIPDDFIFKWVVSTLFWEYICSFCCCCFSTEYTYIGTLTYRLVFLLF